MSHTMNEKYVESAVADFATFLERKDFDNAAAIIDNLGNIGYENLALKLHHQLNAAELTWEKMTPEEKQQWAHEENEREDTLLDTDPRDIW
jgi:aspartyl/asparaginyl beta-hydroxylase (cupin superfamily)